MSTTKDNAKEEGGAVSGESTKPPENAETVKAARGTLFTLILRLISFVCTQLTIRALDPSALGTNIQLELLLTTILFISREGFRLALTQNVVAETWTVSSATKQNELHYYIPIICHYSQYTIFWILLVNRLPGSRFP